MIELDISEGDVVLGGKFKNVPITIKKIGRDELNQPIIIDVKNKKHKLLTIRIKNDMDKIKQISEKLKKLGEQVGNPNKHLFGNEKINVDKAKKYLSYAAGYLDNLGMSEQAEEVRSIIGYIDVHVDMEYNG